MTESDILELCSNPNVFYRGRSIYEAERFADVEEEFAPEMPVCLCIQLWKTAMGKSMK